MEYMTFIRITILGMTILFVITMSVILIINRQSRVKSRAEVRQKNVNPAIKRNTIAAALGQENVIPVKLSAMEYVTPKHQESNAFPRNKKFQVVKVSDR